MAATPALSVIIPFFNEEGNVHPVLDEVHEQLAAIPFEVICINDQSSDRTGEELAEAKSKRPATIIVFNHVRRCGKSAALFTGLRAAQGSWIQLLDGDGQNDPADTARLWQQIIAPGAPPRLGIIAGRRNSRNDSGFKWVQSRVANGVRRFVLQDDATDTGCGWKLVRTEAFRELPYFASMHRFLPALIKRAGWDVHEELVNDRRRLGGTSKYGFLDRLGAGMFDLAGMFWLVRRGGYGVAHEWDDPRAG
ncbi:MAG: glycosyltransferase family 2 protein [Hyphomonas sp.]|nr:glycosyltransferase family 2 protein [Hyphomonas sp.]